MGYIGRDNRVVSFTKQSFTANGVLTSFTLDYGVGDSSGILVSVGGVVQQPGVAYTASGTTLTFTAAPGIGTPVWVVYLGRELMAEKGTLYSDSDSQIGVGNGTTTPLTLSHSVTNPQSIIVTLNGIAQVPTTDFTVSGTTLTFTTAPDATNDITVYFLELQSTETHITAGSITAAKLAGSGTIPAWNGSALTVLDAADLTGALPAIDGSALTNQPGPIIKSASNPTASSNPTSGAGTMWLNHTTGQMYVLTTATEDSNYWTNVGTGTGDVLNNPPTNPNNTGSFQNINKNSSYQFTFSGATDPDAGDSVTHYHVDQISDGGVLSVSAASVAAGSAHTFNAGAVGVDTNITFRVRAKDSFGAYSSGVTVTMTVLNYVYTVATSANSTNTNGVQSGDYIYHTFNISGTFTVSSAGTDGMDFIVLSGGGGGGSAPGGYYGGGGGGAGGYRSSLTSNGGGASLNSTITAATYTITIGGGGAGAGSGVNKGTSGTHSSIGSTIVPAGGGGAGSSVPSGGDAGSGRCNNGIAGGCGGGGSGGWSGGVGSGGSGSQGYAGGVGNNGDSPGGQGGGGGGGVGGVGVNANSTGGGGTGGIGLAWVDGTSRGGGGGAGTYSGGAGSASSGGGAGGGNAGTANLGGGGGGANHGGTGGNGGKGVVIIRYKFQN
jgi:hypothetical protein